MDLAHLRCAHSMFMADLIPPLRDQCPDENVFIR